MKIVFALPGKSYSGQFLTCWSSLLAFCLKNDIEPVLSQHYSPNIYYSRNLCLQGDLRRGAGQKPFNELNYDYVMWIDSDIIFNINHFISLLTCRLDVVSGLYLMENRTHLATVRDMEMSVLKEQGHFNFLSPQDIESQKDPFEVTYTGMGFMLIKAGVFEKMTYPWFEPTYIQENQGIVDFTTEDVTFGIKLKKLGIKLWVDPKVIVGHEKQIVL
jgi:hypothetical protein